MTLQKITSRDNPRIKHLKKLLEDKEYRHAHGEYVVEGLRALDDVRDVRELFVRQGTPVPDVGAAKVFLVDEKIFKQIAATEQSQGIAAVIALRLLSPAALRRDRRYVLLDRVQDPGNMGTIIRTACAFGFHGVIVTPGCVDPFSPKVVRAAASTVGKTDIIRIGSPAQLASYRVIAADAAGEDVSGFPWPDGFMLAIGNEANGLSEEMRAAAQHRVAIPLQGQVESLNAAVSAAILMYASLSRASRR